MTATQPSLKPHTQAEEARFRARLSEIEQQRMSAIEAAWWRRERAREADLAAARADAARVEAETRALLSKVQVGLLQLQLFVHARS